MFFTAMPLNNYFWFHKEPFSQKFFKEPEEPYFTTKKVLWNRKVLQMLKVLLDPFRAGVTITSLR